MSRARMYLHLVALVAPFVAAGAWCLILYRSDAALALRQVAIFGGFGVVAAQLAALLRWPALERRAREGQGAWLTGIGMALITHALFGILFDIALVASVGGWREAAGTGSPSDLLLQTLFFFAMSVFSIGAVTFPATALLAQKIADLRRKELADEPA